MLAPLKVRDLSSEASGGVCRAIDVPFVLHSASFELPLGSYISGRCLALADDEYLNVVPHVGFGMGSGEVLGNSRDSVFYMDYLKGQPDPQAQQAKQRWLSNQKTGGLAQGQSLAGSCTGQETWCHTKEGGGGLGGG